MKGYFSGRYSRAVMTTSHMIGKLMQTTRTSDCPWLVHLPSSILSFRPTFIRSLAQGKKGSGGFKDLGQASPSTISSPRRSWGPNHQSQHRRSEALKGFCLSDAHCYSQKPSEIRLPCTKTPLMRGVCSKIALECTKPTI
jgi:hypothetical protein